MDWLPLESRMFLSAAYDAETSALYLRFRGGEVYQYFSFTGEQYREFLNAESRGRYFLSHIRDRFHYQRLPKLHAVG